MGAVEPDELLPLDPEPPPQPWGQGGPDPSLGICAPLGSA
jgi:hypothetical protein